MMFGGGQTNRDATDQAFTDPLTGLGNMRRFFDKVDRLIADRADDPAPFTVGILDLDGFKPINDLFGRKAGDEILIQVAMRLRAAMDGQSAVTRVGADEFAFLLPMVFSEEAASEKAKMLIEILSAPYDVGERTARLSASSAARCSIQATRPPKSWSTRPRPRSTRPSAPAAAAWWSIRTRWKRRPSALPASSRRCAAPSRRERLNRISSRSSISAIAR